MTGTVKFYNQEKKFGFITPSDGSKDIFFYKTAVDANDLRNITEGTSVEFDTQEGKKGIEACDVRIA